MFHSKVENDSVDRLKVKHSNIILVLRTDKKISNSDWCPTKISLLSTWGKPWQSSKKGWREIYQNHSRIGVKIPRTG